VSTATRSATTLRLFVAASVPSSLAASIEAAIDPWKALVPGARWTPAERLHLTLRFLGSTEPGRVPWIEDRLAEAAARCRPFDVVVHGLGAFPSPRRARVLWVGLDDAEGRLADLAGAVQEAIAAEYPPDRRSFGPHVTVARCDPPAALPMREVAANLEIGSLAVGEMSLVRSHLGASPRYETLARFALGGGPATRG
jgi:2'-5' RNA ligase